MPALTPGLKGSEDIERIDPRLDVVRIGQRGRKRAAHSHTVLFSLKYFSEHQQNSLSVTRAGGFEITTKTACAEGYLYIADDSGWKV